MGKSRDKEINTAPPRPEEYLDAAIQKAVVQTGLKHPVTLYPLALGISAGVVGMLFNLPVVLSAALGLGIVGPAWAVSQIFFRHEALGSQYLARLHKKQKQYEAYLISQIETGLKQCAGTAELKEKADTGIKQLKSIRLKFANVKELLGMKLRTTEITYGRFLGAAEQVSLSVLDNLNTVASLLKSATSIEPKYIQNRLKEIDSKEAPTKEDEDQRISLRERLALWNSQLQKVDQLMAKNEEAMTEMERISAAVAQWQSGRKFAGSDLESAIKQLHALALSAHEYKSLN
ncbi:MAG: hypothetical protein PVJ19_06435 [Desulfobacteraceae bacterium]|jgi:hypothetical protein